MPEISPPENWRNARQLTDELRLLDMHLRDDAKIVDGKRLVPKSTLVRLREIIEQARWTEYGHTGGQE